MKKVRVLIILLITACILNFQNVFAASGYLAVSASQVYAGDSFVVSVPISSAAAWSIHVSATGPVSGCVINQVDATQDAMNTNKTFTATCTTTGVGTVTVTLSGDVTDASDGNAVLVSGTKIVNVVERPVAPSPSNPTPSTPTTPTVPAAPSGPADTRSTNVNLASLTIDGKEIKYADGGYYLEVGNYVEKVNIAAKAADSKAKVSGTGSKDLKVGENVFNVVVTAERGNTHTYVVKIVRKEFNSLNEVNDLLKDKNDAEIRINKDDKLNKDLINKIIKEKKKLSLVRMSDDGKTILYSFILDGSKIKSVNEFNPSIVSDIESNTDMEVALNYAEGIYLDFSKCGDVPKGVIVRYYVGDKYSNDDLVNLYAYDKSVIKQLKENVKVKDGYVEFEVTNSIRHFISKAKVANAKSNSMNIWMVVSFALMIVVVGLIIYILLSKNKKDVKKTVDSVKDKKTELLKVEKSDKKIKKTLKEEDTFDEIL